MNLTTNELINLKYMMKVISIATWLMLLILAGCSDASPYAEEPSAQERTITLNLDITTKTSAPTTESPDNFHLWIFNGDKLLKYISSNPIWEEIYNGGIDLKATIKTKIDATEVNSIQFYLLLNTNVTDPLGMTPANLKNLTFTLPDQPYSHDNKVPMSGEATLDIFPSQIHYDVEMNAKRCVAKLGIYCTKRTSSSKLIIYSFTLNKVPDKGYLFTPVDNDINYTENRDLLSGNSGGVTIATSYTTELPTDIESVESSFTKIDFDNPYLLENTYGDEQFVTEIVNPGTRYNLTVKYNFNGSDYEQTIYLPKIERNTWYKLYMRMKEIELDTYCQVNSWTEHTMDVPPFE